MAFQKTGAVFKIASSKVLDDFSEWSEFKKQASATAVAEEKQDETKTAEDKTAIDKDAELEIVATIDTDNFIYIHSTIMAGVKTEANGHWITSETEKFINDNNDAWTCEDLLSDYKSFKKATTFVEHVQDLERARGKCVDVIARKLPDTILIDVLFSVAKRHNDLVENIKANIVNAVSMGCSTEKTKCSVCGKESRNPQEYCQHVRSQKGMMVKCSDGKSRKVAEICKNNTFFDISLVANPAFAGAVFRKILSSDQVSTQLLANMLNNKIESFNKDNNTILKAASTEITLQNDGMVKVDDGGKQVSFSQVLPQEELSSMKTILKNETSATKFLGRIIKKFFGKDSGYHPITNTTSDDDFSISYDNYDPIPSSPLHDRIRDAAEMQVELAMIPEEPEGAFSRIARVEQFQCYSCNYQDDLWQVKASSIDNGYKEAVICPECGFIHESINIKRPTKKLSTIDKLQLQDLGYKKSDLEKLSSEQIDSVLRQNIRRSDVSHSIMRALEESDYDKYEQIVNNLKKGKKFVTSREIPVDDDEGVLHFDQHGASVITKNERLEFVATVEDGNYGLFKTETGEEFFMPMALLKKKVIH